MNILKQFIDYHIGIAEEKKSIHDLIGDEAFFNEYRLIYAIGARNSGTTSSIAKMFNTKEDIYVGYNPSCVEYFCKYFTGAVVTNTLKYYDNDWNKARGVIGSIEVQKVYLDIGKSDIQCQKFAQILSDVRKFFPNAYVIVT